MKQVQRPSLTTSNKKYIGRKQVKGFFFERIKDHRVSEHAKRKQVYKWNGYLSPSHGASLNGCPVDYFDKIELFNEADQDGLELMADGTIGHEGLAKEVRKVHGINFLPTNIPLTLEGWYKSIYPELPISCDVTGWRGKCDYVIDVFGTPAPFDYKRNYPASEEKWQEFVKDTLPKIENFTQVCIYANRMQAAGYFHVPIQYMGLGHHNACMKPNKRGSKLEYWWSYDEELAWYVQNFVYTWAIYRSAKLSGHPKGQCEYEYCKIHGDDREIWYLIDEKRLDIR